MTLEEQIAEAKAEGFELIQEGKVLIPFNVDPQKAKLSFSERVEGFDLGRLGAHDETNGWRSPYENKILDDDERWVHLRKDRES